MSRRPRILVVDDDPDIREILTIVLDAAGLDVASASDGTEALEKLAEEPSTELVVLDLMMPRMSGPDFVKRLRMTPELAGTPIVVLSGDVRGAEQAKHLGVSAFFGKPVDLSALTKGIWGALPPGKRVLSS